MGTRRGDFAHPEGQLALPASSDPGRFLWCIPTEDWKYSDEDEHQPPCCQASICSFDGPHRFAPYSSSNMVTIWHPTAWRYGSKYIGWPFTVTSWQPYPCVRMDSGRIDVLYDYECTMPICCKVVEGTTQTKIMTDRVLGRGDTLEIGCRAAGPDGGSDIMEARYGLPWLGDDALPVGTAIQVRASNSGYSFYVVTSIEPKEVTMVYDVIVGGTPKYLQKQKRKLWIPFAEDEDDLADPENVEPWPETP